VPTKIESELTPAEVAKLCQKLFGTEGGRKLRVIREEAAKYGVAVSKNGATTFRDNVLDPSFAALRAKAERARQVAAFAKEGLSMADAASVRLSETVFDELESADARAGMSSKEKEIYSRIIARARTGDQRAVKLEADLDSVRLRNAALTQRMEMMQFDAAQAVLDHAAEIRLVVADTTLDADARRERVRKLLWGEQPAGFTPIAAAGKALEEDAP
jgi:hypothetical protein